MRFSAVGSAVVVGCCHGCWLFDCLLVAVAVVVVDVVVVAIAIDVVSNSNCCHEQ